MLNQEKNDKWKKKESVINEIIDNIYNSKGNQSKNDKINALVLFTNCQEGSFI